MFVQPTIEYRHFSAEVRIQLYACGQVFRVARVGPEEITLHADQFPDVAPTNAEIILFVDGDQFVWPVRLPHGLVPFSREACIEPLDEMKRVTHQLDSSC